MYISAVIKACRRRLDIPTALSSMMPWALVFAADIAAGLTREPKNLRKKEILGDDVWVRLGCVRLIGNRGEDYSFEGD